MKTSEYGIVLSSNVQNDNDLRINVLTNEHGKITCFVKNARKQNNDIKGKVRPLTFGKFDIYYGRNYNKLNSVDIVNSFDFFYSHLDENAYASYLLEFANYYSTENNDEKDFLRLVYISLLELSKKTKSCELIKSIFEFKYLVISGEYPDSSLVKTNETIYLDIKSKKFINDGFDSQFLIKISNATFKLCNYLIKENIKKTYSFKISETVELEFINLVSSYYRYNHPHEFNSLLYLKV